MLYLPDFYTVESVTSGHPDKVCDQISDAILDACLTQDPHSRVAVETFGSNGLIVVGGEVTTKAEIDYAQIARKVYRQIGYTDSPRIEINISEQSNNIAQGVDTGGAGDQGIMYGFATDETDQYLPRGLVLAHTLAKGLDELRKEASLPWLKPDGKTQVTVNKDRIQTILVSCQHDAQISQEEIRQQIIDKLIEPSLWDDNINEIKILVNPTGSFVKGGFEADTGLTGRKIMVDTYGGLAPHGGGAFSGKDATKVDRSGAYMARFVAKNAVRQGLGHTCQVSVAYSIGQAEPIMVTAYNEKREDLWPKLKKDFDFSPTAIIERLNLGSPIFSRTACYGHFGHKDCSW